MGGATEWAASGRRGAGDEVWAGTVLGDGLVNMTAVRWDRTEVRHVRWSADRAEAVVTAVHWSAGDPAVGPLRQRWWVAGRPGDWRVYDAENPATGFRVSHL